MVSVVLSDASYCVSETSNCYAFVNVHECINMRGFAFREQAAMNFTDGHDPSRLCQENFPDQKQPNSQNAAAVYRGLAQTATLALVTAERGRPSRSYTWSREGCPAHVAGIEVSAGENWQQRSMLVTWPFGGYSVSNCSYHC
jgi:hypothetical protein